MTSWSISIKMSDSYFPRMECWVVYNAGKILNNKPPEIEK